MPGVSFSAKRAELRSVIGVKAAEEFLAAANFLLPAASNFSLAVDDNTSVIFRGTQVKQELAARQVRAQANGLWEAGGGQDEICESEEIQAHGDYSGCDGGCSVYVPALAAAYMELQGG